MGLSELVQCSFPMNELEADAQPRIRVMVTWAQEATEKRECTLEPRAKPIRKKQKTGR